MNDIYTSGEYLQTNETWHSEDAPWKGQQVGQIIETNKLRPKRIGEVGCGAGVLLEELSKMAFLQEVEFRGYDISPQAIELAQRIQNDRIQFACEDVFSLTNQEYFDILLVIDVFEHVADYLGFLEKCRRKAEYKIYHIPLEIHVSSVIRNKFIQGRYTIGHLHYFTAESAIATLRDTGHEIVDVFYTRHGIECFRLHPSFRKAVANVPRWIFAKISLPLTARMLGGYSLLVLAK